MEQLQPEEFPEIRVAPCCWPGVARFLNCRPWRVAGTRPYFTSSRAGSGDGANPSGPVVFDQSGNIYGTTSDGGPYILGTLFKLSSVAGGGWTESVIHNFGNGSDGKYPAGDLVLDAAGNLYGAASAGGASGGVSNNGQGTIFEITP